MGHFSMQAGFKDLVKVVAFASYTPFAEGRVEEATRMLNDALTLSRNISERAILGYLVGVACQAIVLAEYEKRLPQLSTSELSLVLEAANRTLNRDSALIAAMRREKEEALWLMEWTLNEARKEKPKPDEDGVTDASQSISMPCPRRVSRRFYAGLSSE